MSLRRALFAAISAAAISIALAVWVAGTAAQAVSLYRFEAEPPASLMPQLGSVIGGSGFGPLSLDVVATELSGTVKVVRDDEAPRSSWPRPELMVGEHGAYYADESPPSGSWIPFAIAAAVGAAISVSLAWFALSSLRRNADRIAFVLFGQNAAGVKPLGWLPGHGGHGGDGGQVPPFVAHSEDWEPRSRIR